MSDDTSRVDIGLAGGEELDAFADVGSDESAAIVGTSRRSQSLFVALIAVVLVAIVVVGYLVVAKIREGDGPTTLAGKQIASLTEKIAANPKDYSSYFQLTEVYYGLQDYDKALETLGDMRSQEPTGTALAQLMLGEAKINDTMGNTDEAVRILLDAIELRELAEARYALAEIYARRSQWAEAVAEYERYLEFDPTDAGAQVHLAQAYEQIGDTESALAAYREAAKFLPDDPEIASAVQRLGGEQ